MKQLLRRAIPLVDILFVPFVAAAALLLRSIRKHGIQKFRLCKATLIKLGVFPIRNHYYEPFFNPKKLRHSLRDQRDLPGIDWNIEGQLELLKKFRYREELIQFPDSKTQRLEFYYDNGSFKSGDAEFLYNMIRHYKPMKIIEVGSGNSTLMAINAIRRNRSEDTGYECEHVCIEPYERPWLESTGVRVIRKIVEETNIDLFRQLSDRDLLFIDSSHVIRPQGDVLTEYLQILPILNEGVIVHIHDIFTPADYLDEWVIDDVRFWNEQYLLEAFLTSNKDWTILGALNLLKHKHFESLLQKCPKLTSIREPGSFYMQKRKPR